MPTFEINGITVAYTDTGAPAEHPEAPTIVFGHGLLFGGWMFRAQVAALADRYRCVTIDWRGQGETPAAPDGYDMDTLTGDAIALIEHLGIAPVHWVGLSMGGFVGQRIALHRADLLRSLTLLDTSAGPENPKKVPQYRMLSFLYGFVGAKRLERLVAPIMVGPSFRADPTYREVADEWMDRFDRVDRTGMRKAIAAVIYRKSMEDEVSAIKTPTLVAVGAEDVATPVAKSERLVELIPGARLEVIPKAGHSSTLENPEAVTALISEFLAKQHQ